MTIGIWGDSITYGAGDSEALGWVGRLRKALLSKEGEYPEIYNLGVCGDTSTDVLRRFDVEAEGVKPDLIVFAIGINDSKYSAENSINNVPLAAYEANLNLLIQKARVHASSIVLISATKVHDGWRSVRGSQFFNEQIAEYNKIMKFLADREQLVFIDVFDTLNPNIDLEDGLHPNAGGYQKMFEVIKPLLN